MSLAGGCNASPLSATETGAIWGPGAAFSLGMWCLPLIIDDGLHSIGPVVVGALLQYGLNNPQDQKK